MLYFKGSDYGRYRGCWQDDFFQRDISGSQYVMPDEIATIDHCINHCMNEGKSFVSIVVLNKYNLFGLIRILPWYATTEAAPCHYYDIFLFLIISVYYGLCVALRSVSFWCFWCWNENAESFSALVYFESVQLYEGMQLY